MNKIQMVDLKGQYNKIQDKIDNAVLDVIKSTSYINGPQVKNFQKSLEDYLGVKHVIPCGNGTDALQVSLMALGLEPGDEVITADFTFAATVEVIELLQLKSVLVDVNPDTYTIDTEAIKKAITPKTKAIIPVHLFGQVANMDEILDIAKKYNLKVIEDTAQAIGAEYTFVDGTVKKAGTIGDCGTTSFFPSKNLGGYGDGGAVFTNDDDLAYKLRGIVNHGMYKRYYHDEVGVNSRLDSIQAAILNVKLQYLDSYSEARHDAAMFYNDAFKEINSIIAPITSDNSTHVFHQYVMRVIGVNRDELKEHLEGKGIPAMIYYPVPLHLQKAYSHGEYDDSNFSITNMLVDEVIALPMHTELTKEELDYITTAVIEFINSNTK